MKHFSLLSPSSKVYFNLVKPKMPIKKKTFTERLFLISQNNLGKPHQDSKPVLEIRSLFSVQNRNKANRKLLKSV